jgi:hypothetical protein
MYAKGMDEEEAAVWLDEVLSGVGNGKKATSRAKPKAKAAATV